MTVSTFQSTPDSPNLPAQIPAAKPPPPLHSNQSASIGDAVGTVYPLGGQNPPSPPSQPVTGNQGQVTLVALTGQAASPLSAGAGGAAAAGLSVFHMSAALPYHPNKLLQPLFQPLSGITFPASGAAAAAGSTHFPSFANPYSVTSPPPQMRSVAAPFPVARLAQLTTSNIHQYWLFLAATIGDVATIEELSPSDQLNPMMGDEKGLHFARMLTDFQLKGMFRREDQSKLHKYQHIIDASIKINHGIPGSVGPEHYGKTPLHMAAWSGHEAAVNALLQWNQKKFPNVNFANAKDASHKTPFDYAYENRDIRYGGEQHLNPNMLQCAKILQKLTDGATQEPLRYRTPEESLPPPLDSSRSVSSTGDWGQADPVARANAHQAAAAALAQQTAAAPAAPTAAGSAPAQAQAQVAALSGATPPLDEQKKCCGGRCDDCVIA